MPTTIQWVIHAAAVLIEFGGGLFVVVGCLRGLAALALGGASEAAIVRCRLSVADGVIAALGFKTAATLLKTIELQTWNAILTFAAIFALRTFVKQFLVWEERRLQAQAGRTSAMALR